MYMQMSLISGVPAVSCNATRSNSRFDLVYSASQNEKEIIRSVMRLHLSGQPFDADLTYSVGNTWRGLEGPRLKFDIEPEVDGVIQADCTDLRDHIGDKSLRSVFVDLPYLVSTGKGSAIKNRFQAFDSIDHLNETYIGTIKEAWRILNTGGVFVIKVQGSVYSGKQYFTDLNVVRWAEDLGFYLKDRITLVNYDVMIRSGNYTQRHARRVDTPFFVFQKRKVAR